MDAVKDFLDTFGRPAAWLAGAVVAAILLHTAMLLVLRFCARRTRFDVDDWLVRYLSAPARLTMVSLAALWVMPMLGLTSSADRMLRHGISLVIVAGVFWLLSRAVTVLQKVMLARWEISPTSTVRTRRLNTQVALLGRFIRLTLGIVAFGAILMTFPAVQKVGVGVLASAGAVGIVIGIAAQRTLGNVMAGVMIAFTQPIRIDDVVFLEGEWGRIEEVTLTYVVVRVWDLRRLVVPITYFVEQPFQNWTRLSPDLLGYSLLYLDHNAPIPRINEQLRKICEQSENWDGKVAEVQIIDSTETTVLAWALVSAGGAWKAWDLRCEVREKLIEWMREEIPWALPRRRLVGAPTERTADPPIIHTETTAD
ncbi:MAG: mechanosensitive ion channel family protein [Phycisphaerae bacterium]